MQSTIRSTSFLPPLRQLSFHTPHSIQQALAGLRSLYFPPVPPKLVLHKRHAVAARIHDISVPDSGYASAEGEDGEEDEVEEEVSQKLIGHEDIKINVLRSDPFEREHAVKWLIGLIARSDTWIAEALQEEGYGDTFEERSRVVDDAASLLSSFAGDAEPEPALTRDFSFPRSSGGSPIYIQSNDGALLTTDHTSVGLQSWASSIILAERICWVPSSFHFNSLNRPGVRILELGAGTGLLSIVASKFLPAAEIIATDYHPDVLANLRLNVTANVSGKNQSPISVHALDWSNPPTEDPFSEESFDMILAADVIYHPDHARWIKSCVQRYLRRNRHSDSHRPMFWLIIPLRSTGRHEGMDAAVEHVFPTLDSTTNSSLDSENGELVILHKEEIARRSGVGRADEGSYVLFQVCWR
ncbi:S-adenosyl-L-methionine-dependent methyltransferase [Thelephora ganbajun]|uniref:S-adenosyl-L-methionine-dependent methyltransferase n=1 Tax=Thelephora ganbajun TaxID=370292 RepID=A0ACB6ZMB2_THEGA|nr:S-adenosyl-L-methionine-dependent methyltransferase [Thelephora ganbajun]